MHLSILSLVINKVLDNPALNKVLGYYKVYVFGLNAGVKGALGVYDYNRASLAQSEAARAHYLYFLAQAVFLYKLLKPLYNFERIGGGAARSAAN